jgi:dTDP-4-amino-4,6-dideoxygalactose transaminase
MIPSVKQLAADLAILGGTPAFEEIYHVGKPNIGDRDRFLGRVNDILDRAWLTNDGVYVREFEGRVADLLGVRHCIAMCNATVALEIAERALDLHGEVIVPAMTFIATAHSLYWQGITPIFCDVDPHTHNIDPKRVEQLITPRTSGIVGVHLWGRACAVDELEEIAHRRGLKLMFDAAHAFGCSSRGRMIGGCGDAEVLSFHATKFINSLEGGAVVTNDDTLAEKIRLMRNFGFAGLDNVIYIGTNGKMNEISAAMGITSLDSLDEIIAVNRRNYDLYRAGLAGLPGIRIMDIPAEERSNYQYIVLEIDEDQARLSRDMLVSVLHAERVRARRYFFPGCHRMEPYRSYFPNAGLLLPVTERLVEQVLVLPTGTRVAPEDVAIICRIIRLAVENAEPIRSILEGKPLQMIRLQS